MEVLEKKVLNADEAAEYVGYKKSYLKKLAAAKKIPHSRPSRARIFFDKEKLDRWMLGNPQGLTQTINH